MVYVAIIWGSYPKIQYGQFTQSSLTLGLHTQPNIYLLFHDKFLTRLYMLKGTLDHTLA